MTRLADLQYADFNMNSAQRQYFGANQYNNSAMMNGCGNLLSALAGLGAHNSPALVEQSRRAELRGVFTEEVAKSLRARNEARIRAMKAEK